MPKAKRAGKARAAREAVEMLAALAGDGAYATATTAAAEGARSFAVHLAGSDAPLPGREVSQAAAAHALRMGWVTPDATGTRLHISNGGRCALQAARAREGPGGASVLRARKIEAGRTGGESALSWLRNRRDKDGRPLVTEVQFTAGERLAGDFWHAQMSPRVTASWSVVAPGRRTRRSTPGFGVEMRDAVVAARLRFQRAVDAVAPENRPSPSPRGRSCSASG